MAGKVLQLLEELLPGVEKEAVELTEKEAVRAAEKEAAEVVEGGIEKEAEKEAVREAEKETEREAEKVAEREAEKAAKKDLVEAEEAAVKAEAVIVESEAGLEATIKAETEAVEAAEKAAELEVGLGTRIAKAVGKKIVQVLKTALEKVKMLAGKSDEIILMKMAIDDVPQEHRKELASWAMMLAASGNMLAIVAYAYIKLTGGSEEGKKVAKEAKQIVNGLHENARKLKIDSPSKVPKTKEASEADLKQIKLLKASDKKDIDELDSLLGKLGNITNNHEDNPRLEGEEIE